MRRDDARVLKRLTSGINWQICTPVLCANYSRFFFGVARRAGQGVVGGGGGMSLVKSEAAV
jgi:hypothetical protein